MVIALDYESEIHYAMAFNLTVMITTKLTVFEGKVHYIDSLNKQIRAKDENGELYHINFDDIVNIQVHD